MDDLKKVQSYLDYNIKRSDMKGRHKRVAGITMENLHYDGKEHVVLSKVL